MVFLFGAGGGTRTRHGTVKGCLLYTSYNCRITAFSLFGEFVTVGADQPKTQGEDTLFLALEPLTEDPAVLCGDSTAKFCALFAPVPAADSTDVDEQAQTLQAGWAARGVAFSDSPARLISVVLHDRFSDTENTPVSYTHLDVYKRQPILPSHAEVEL